MQAVNFHLVFVSLTLGTLLFSLVQPAFADSAEEQRQPVKAELIRVDRITRHISTFGKLSPKTEELSFRIAGRIASFRVEEGAEVTAGQLLAKLETKDAEDALKKQRVSLDQAKRNLQRFQKLHEERSIQKSQLEDAQDRFEQARIAFDQAQLNLDRCALKAPAAGVILKEYLESRTSVAAGTPIYAFQSNSEVWVTKVELTDKNAFALGEGTTAKIRFAPYPGIEFNGTLTRLSRVANPGDGLYTAEITLTTEDHPLRPGMIAEVDLFNTSDEDYTLVPLDALVDVRREFGTIYLVSSDKQRAMEKRVTIARILANDIALVEDLSDYKKVIVRGQTNLHDKSAIEIID